MVILITGVAGFLGSNLAEFLLKKGNTVIGLDNYITGQKRNVDILNNYSNFSFIECDLIKGVPSLPNLDRIYHLASPASPIHYVRYPLETLYVNSHGTQKLLETMERQRSKNHCRILFASTSEVYGDPLVHPQPESYWGNVNPIGPRSIYDEAKRYGETICSAYERELDTDVKLIRIFNTYGPRMRHDDGRVIPCFIKQALQKKPLTIFGDGLQTRSFCFVSDLIRGMHKLMESDLKGPCNIGTTHELTMIDLANQINLLAGNTAQSKFLPLPQDDPMRRRPDLTRATNELKWKPEVDFINGLEQTFSYFKQILKEENLI